MKAVFLSLILMFAVQAQAKTIEIKMLNNGKDGMMVFEPAFVKAEVGDTIKFVATDPAHNSESLLVPEGAKTWKGALDEEVTIKLDKEGIYLYVCEPHISMAMVGVIQVGKPTNLDVAKVKAEEFKRRFAMNKDRFDKYLGNIK